MTWTHQYATHSLPTVDRSTHEIAADPLVHEQCKPGEDHAPTSLQDVAFEQSSEVLHALFGFDRDCGADSLDLADHIRVVWLEVKDGANNFDRFFFPTTLS